MKRIFAPVAILLATGGSVSFAGHRVGSPEWVCERLLNPAGRGIWATQEKRRPATPELPNRKYSDFTETDENLSDVLRGFLGSLPFGHALIEDVPSLRELNWTQGRENIYIELQSGEKNRLIVTMDTRGIVDIKISASDNLSADKKLYRQIIEWLQKQHVEALLFARYAVLPPDPEDGFDLLVTRLDASRKQDRAFLASILELFR